MDIELSDSVIDSVRGGSLSLFWVVLVVPIPKSDTTVQCVATTRHFGRVGHLLKWATSLKLVPPFAFLP